MHLCQARHAKIDMFSSPFNPFSYVGRFHEFHHSTATTCIMPTLNIIVLYIRYGIIRQCTVGQSAGARCGMALWGTPNLWPRNEDFHKTRCGWQRFCYITTWTRRRHDGESERVWLFVCWILLLRVPWNAKCVDEAARRRRNGTPDRYVYTHIYRKAMSTPSDREVGVIYDGLIGDWTR